MSGGVTPIPTNAQVDLEVRCQPQSHVLGSIRCVLTALAQNHGFDDEAVEQIEMAADEACANIVNHAYSDLLHSASGEDIEMYLRIQIVLMRKGMTLRIIDNGIGLRNKTDHGADSVDEFVERGGRGGLGLHIMEQFMDEVRYEYPGERGTCVVMTKLFESQNSTTK